jgi:hypothetical protein
VGSIFEVRFWVFDQQSPARNASATRTVVVLPPCAPGEQFCAVDEGCGVASCAIREAVRATPPVDLSAPNLTLTTHELTLDYGTASPVTLAACKQGAPHSSRPGYSFERSVGAKRLSPRLG